MKSSINLYQARFAPRVDFYSLSSLTVVFAVSAARVLIIGITFRLLAGNVESELVAATSQNKMLQSQVDMLQDEVSNWKPDPELIAQVDLLKLDLVKQRRVLEELHSRAPLRYKGFSVLLDDLAEQSASDLWLETLRVTETEMDFTGEVSAPAAFPKWLQRLSDTRSFSGRDFDEARVFMQEDSLKFELRTRRSGSATSAGGETR